MINHVNTIDGRKFHNIYKKLHLVSLPVLARGNRFVFTNRHGNLGFPNQSWDRPSPHTYQACAYGVEVFTFTSQFPEYLKLHETATESVGQVTGMDPAWTLPEKLAPSRLPTTPPKGRNNPAFRVPRHRRNNDL